VIEEEARDRYAAKLIRSTSQADKLMAAYRGPKEDLEPKPLPLNEIRVTAADDRVNGILRIEVENAPNDQAKRIVLSVLPKVLSLYLNKSKDYDGNVMAMFNLGPKACFVDLWRKVGKLKGALWDGRPMVGEQADEILMDLVGHTLIILDELWTDEIGPK
jgi:hypothetical protein